MKVSDLFLTSMEPELDNWLRKFTSVGDLFAAVPQLYANLSGQNIQGIVEDGASINGPVHVGKGSVVRSQAIIRGPAIVGNDVVVDSHSEIGGGSFVGSRCLIGHSCFITGSMVMNNVTVCPGAFVRNSLIGFATMVGPNATIGVPAMNRSLGYMQEASSDIGAVLGDYADVGANSIIKPGTIVGSCTIIGEGVLASGTYGPKQTVTMRQTLDVKPRIL